MIKQTANTIRQVFKPRTVFPDYRVNLADFKGHQSKALTKMNQLSPQIDLVLELRDSRAPISTTNVLIDRVFTNKVKIVLYTKKDLSTLGAKILDKWHKPLNEQWQFVDCRSPKDIERLLKSLREKFYQMFPPPPLGLRLMVVGMPNVGKSTLVNSLRKRGLGDSLKTNKSVARVGNHAGITRKTSEIIRISEKPEILLYDTPGVLLPQVNDIKTMLSLSLIGTVSLSNIDSVIACDYLLFVMNLYDPSGKPYKKYLNHPTNDIMELLGGISRKTKNFSKVKGGEPKVNYNGCALQMLSDFKTGKLGRWCLDLEVLRKKSGEEFKEQLKEERLRVGSMDSIINREKDNSEKKDYNQRRADKANQLFDI